MLLTGSYVRGLDDKLRIVLPRPIREALGTLDPSVLFVAPGTDGSLAVYTEAVFSQMAALLAADSPAAVEMRAFSRLFYAQAQRVDVDRQGRVRIPLDLARWAELDNEVKEVVLLGVRDHLEIWNRDRWEAYLADQQARYDEIAERAFSKRGLAGAAENTPIMGPSSESSSTNTMPSKPR